MTTATRAWVKRNLGFDPIATPPPTTTFATAVASTKAATPEDLQREIIDFDSESPQGAAFFTFSTATGLSRYTDIPWPGAAPGRTPSLERALGRAPKADALVVTWTVDEGMP